ncbi:MAG: hypothetical protein P1U65_04450 [Minwuia sp.]|nr:hypothetical protein [Minwuia sp.]
MEVTCFEFEHRVFTLPGAYIFGSGLDRKPMLHVEMGELHASMPIDGLIREFGITPDSRDFELITIAQDALKYVHYISPGDSIPTEIIDGTASWPIGPEHFESAKNQLMLKLAAWATGSSMSKSSNIGMSNLLQDPEVQKNIQRGFEQAATALKLESREKVVEMIERLGREIGYIHALQEYYVWVFSIRRHLKGAQSLLKGDSQALENAIRADHLAEKSTKEFKQKFIDVDAQIDDIVSALSNLPNVIEFVRVVRDDLHMGTLVWSEIEEVWRSPKFETRDSVRRAISGLYTFLAQKFLKSDW